MSPAESRAHFRVVDASPTTARTVPPETEAPVAAEIEAELIEATDEPIAPAFTEPPGEPPSSGPLAAPFTEARPEPAEPEEAPVDEPEAFADAFSPEITPEPEAIGSAAETEIEFNQQEAPRSEPEPEVKTVKVRSSIDVMAELEALRKRATGTTTKPSKRDVLADLASLRPKRDLNRTLHVKLPADLAAKARSLRVTLSFEDGEEGVIDAQTQRVELGDTSDVQSVSVNLKIDLS